MKKIQIVGFLTLLSAPSLFAALLVDDFDGQGLGAQWSTYADANSKISPSPFHPSPASSGQCGHLDFELKAGVPYPYAGVIGHFHSQDLSTYEGIRFQARGQGAWSCMLPIPATATEYNHFCSPFFPTSDRELVEIPFSKLTQLWGTKKTWDPSSVTGVQFSAGGRAGDKGWLEVDDIEFYKKGEEKAKGEVNNPIQPEPKVDQDGYFAEGEKYFVMTATEKVRKGDPFQVLDASGKAAFSGSLKDEAVDDTPSTGEKVFKGDLTALKAPGRYTIGLDNLKSVPFTISGNPFHQLFKDSLRCFYLIRCGTAIDDPLTGLKHDACHMKDAPFKSDPSQHGDFTGGWHNAGDYGKWTHMEAISCAWMMWLYELKPQEMSGFKNDIPESKNKMSDLLNEAKWGLDWLLKMQAPDGGVYHKVDPMDHFCFGTVPEKDPTERFLQGEGAIDAGVFIGVMCQAARVFKDLDPAYAKRCRQAALKAWAWLEKNPTTLFQDPDYGDSDPSQEKLWALGEMARLTGDPALAARFTQEATDAALQTVSWMTPQFFGYMALAFDPKSSPGEKTRITQALAHLCDGLVDLSDKNGYGVCLTHGDYYWGSNENLLNKTAALLFAERLTGDNKYRTCALRQMNYILGLNSLNRSFVTGHGEKAESHPHHWDYASYHIVMPGWVGGGANQYPTGADPMLLDLINHDTPPAKCFFDGAGTTSWASNEGQTVENAAMVFDAGYLTTQN